LIKSEQREYKFLTVADFGCCRCSLFSDSVETLDILRYSETGQSKVNIILLESFFYIKGREN
jgi:hypothetical protein